MLDNPWPSSGVAASASKPCPLSITCNTIRPSSPRRLSHTREARACLATLARASCEMWNIADRAAGSSVRPRPSSARAPAPARGLGRRVGTDLVRELKQALRQVGHRYAARLQIEDVGTDVADDAVQTLDRLPHGRLALPRRALQHDLGRVERQA